MKKQVTKPVVFLPCSGVGHTNRGYESFTIQCFEQLKNVDEFNLILLKSAGKTSDKEINISCVKRDGKFANTVAKLFKVKQYWIEEFSFCMNMIPSIIKYKPSVIYYSDTPLGKFLWYVRKVFGFKYKLLLSNGGPKSAPYEVEDHIQQLLEQYVVKAVNSGTPASKQTMLHYGFDIPSTPTVLNNSQKTTLRNELRLPVNKKIIISVGAVNEFHKRMHYVVKEFSFLNKEDYYLIVLGNIDNNSKSILEQATSTLLKDSYMIKQAKPDEVANYLLASDYFLLASFTEGSPRVVIEALQFGLVPIVHDYEVVHEVLQQYGVYGNLAEENILLSLIKKVDVLGYTKEELWRYAYLNYSWEQLKDQYIKLILQNIN